VHGGTRNVGRRVSDVSIRVKRRQLSANGSASSARSMQRPEAGKRISERSISAREAAPVPAAGRSRGERAGECSTVGPTSATVGTAFLAPGTLPGRAPPSANEMFPPRPRPPEVAAQHGLAYSREGSHACRVAILALQKEWTAHSHGVQSAMASSHWLWCRPTPRAARLSATLIARRRRNPTFNNVLARVAVSGKGQRSDRRIVTGARRVIQRGVDAVDPRALGSLRLFVTQGSSSN
jgi:hypothetical protein